MAKYDWPAVAGLACAALAVEAVVGFGLWFTPGWANQWPGGLSIHFVWPAGLTAVAAVMLMTAMIGFGSILASLRKFWSGRSPSRTLTIRWLATAVAGTTVVSAYLFTFLRAEALALWPNGYNP